MAFDLYTPNYGHCCCFLIYLGKIVPPRLGGPQHNKVWLTVLYAQDGAVRIPPDSFEYCGLRLVPT